MCYHHRILYGGCNHSAWLGKVRSCEIEQGFEAGLTNEGCGWMFAHPLKTTRLSGLCPDCDKKKTWSAAKLGKIKALLKTLQEDMARRRSTGDDCSDQTTEVASGSDSPGSSGITAGVAGTEVAGLEMAPDAYEEASGVETGGIIEKNELYVAGICLHSSMDKRRSRDSAVHISEQRAAAAGTNSL